MNDPLKTNPDGLADLRAGISNDIKVLGIAGFAGAACNALKIPKGTLSSERQQS